MPKTHMESRAPVTTTEYLASVLAEPPWYERRGPPLLSPRVYLRVKRLIDLTLSSLIAPFVLVVILLCAAAIRLDSPGPAFFSQLRTGRDGRRFKIYKLRTMVRNAEELKNQLLHLNELTLPDFKITNDPRLTRVGRVLRRTSLDELPQLLNVFLGNMSLVGPRPTSFKANTYKLWHTTRVEATPGITGLAQVSGRCELDFDERLRMDIAYLRNRCLWLDFQILIKTVTTIFSGRGAC